MKRYSAFRTILEITTIIGYIAIAMTILTYIIRGVAFDRIALGLRCLFVRSTRVSKARCPRVPAPSYSTG